jgi:hypothetical protein
MTTTLQPSPPPVVAPELQPSPRRSRRLPVTVGAALAVAGSLVVIAGSGVLALAGTDGTIGSGKHDISTPTAALVSDTAEFEDTSDVASAIGNPEVGVTAYAEDGGPAKFVGIGPSADVDRYLANVQVDSVDDFDVDPFELDKQREHPNGTADATAPGDQTFWVAQSTGQKAEVDWKVRDGDYKVVVMNADGSQGVAADGRLEVGLPYLSTYALGILLAGLIAIGAGITLMARNLNGRAA